MSFLLKASSHVLTRIFGRPSALEEVCDNAYELCAAERQVVPPAIFLERDLERITGVEPFTTLEQEMRRVRGGEQINTATVAYELSDLTLSAGRLFKGGWRHRLLVDAPPSTASEIEVESGTLASTFFGCRYFGHWMTDDVSMGLLAEKTGDPFVPERKLYTHEEEYNRILRLRPTVMNRARFERLTLLDDVGQNSDKRRRYRELRRRLAERCPPASGRRIFLHRSGGGAGRVLENEAEIADLLERLSFRIIDPSRLSGLEVAQQMSGAEIVMGMEGSQLGHALYTIADHGVLCALQPPYRFNNVFKGHADCVGFRYALLAGTPSAQGFRIELDEMRELVDRLARTLTGSRLH